MCGFIGIVAPAGQHVIGDLYDGLLAIQHRGQDAAGALTYDGRFHLQRGGGLVRDVFGQDAVQRLRGNLGVGHVRYPTVGGGGEDDAQPIVVNAPYGIGMAHNGNLINFTALKRELTERDHRHVDTDCDVEAVLQVFAHSLSQSLQAGDGHSASGPSEGGDLHRSRRGLSTLQGGVLGRGDDRGLRTRGIPAIPTGSSRSSSVSGKSRTASRSAWPRSPCCWDVLDYHKSSNVAPGEAVIVRMDGSLMRRQVVPANHHPCLFEWVYFARPDSFLDRVSVYKTRLRLGESMAELWRQQTDLPVDVVIPVPESARDAAASMARALGVKYREGLVKNRYVGRTFIMPDDEERRRSIRHKLNAIQLEFEDKDVLLVDDSIVRGNTSKQIVQMARDAGARRVYFASYSPPLCHPCVYGIDMSTRNEFVARGRSPEEIAREIGADFVLYQSLQNLEEAVREGNDELQHFCNACFTGTYPTGDVDAAVLRQIEGERLVVHGRNGAAVTAGGFRSRITHPS